ncbi:GHKL domain-containing protein [Herbivorax sp. ANBcel31]|uniref:sensor histidine kinase n=1 Tax=Herbivorax sp. ANBcel31 TaxID=3069754 RepID=UPI0027B5EE39|nr:GHKL domain-containing protein [Herbivorax sp. ANBcel31]MDQ2085084.1 GHKL domain-containing protein [Herbivorax sp. ANBcel31]
MAIFLNSFFFKKDVIDSSIDYAVFIVIGFPVGLFFELAFTFIGLLNIGIENDEVIMSFYMFLMSIYSIIIFLFVPLKKVVDRYRSILRKSFLIIFNVFIFYFISREDFLINSSRNITIIFLSYLAIIMSSIFIVKEYWSAKNKESLKRQHAELLENFDSIIEDIRSKQHDFKNHITTLKNLCFTDKETYEKIASSYISSTIEENSNIDYLTISNNKIINSIVYIKSCLCNSKDIKFVFECSNKDIQFPLEDYEITSVISNLVDNAIESIESSNPSRKEILLKITSCEKKKSLQVSNTGNPIPYELHKKIFSKGYTTKKNKTSHGYGLYNIKKIIQKQGGHIFIINNDSYVTFEILFES